MALRLQGPSHARIAAACAPQVPSRRLVPPATCAVRRQPLPARGADSPRRGSTAASPGLGGVSLPRQSKQCSRRPLRVAPVSASRRSAGGGARGDSAEQALKATVELDKLIDSLRSTDARELPQVIAENIFSFDQKFWMRLATRADSCSSEADRQDLEELSNTVMSLVERMVRRTEERMDASSDKLAELLMSAALVDVRGSDEEIVWPPKDPAAIPTLKDVLGRRDREGALDDSLLASVTAQLRQATERKDRPGLVAMLQKVLQLYAALRFGARSYATNSDGKEDAAEALLESLLTGDVEQWDSVLRAGLRPGGGPVSEEEFFAALELRSQRMLMRTESGSYEQRILGEYLAELDVRARAVLEAFRTA